MKTRRSRQDAVEDDDGDKKPAAQVRPTKKRKANCNNNQSYNRKSERLTASNLASLTTGDFQQQAKKTANVATAAAAAATKPTARRMTSSTALRNAGDKTIHAADRSKDKPQTDHIVEISSDEEDGSTLDYVHLVTRNRPVAAAQAQQDAALAAYLLTPQENGSLDPRKILKELSMKSNQASRSFLLVEDVIRLLLPYVGAGVQPLGRDEAVFFADQIFKLQTSFMTKRGRKTKKPHRVEIAYHFTTPDKLQAIRTNGMLTLQGQVEFGIDNNPRNAAHFGDGIYTTNNPHAFAHCGEIGLLVAILKGKSTNVGSDWSRKAKPGIDTVIGNMYGEDKTHRTYTHEVVLKKSSQVLPLLSFQTERLSHPAFVEQLWSVHQQIQHQVIDKYFNKFKPAKIERILPSAGKGSSSAVTPATTFTVVYKGLQNWVLADKTTYQEIKAGGGECAICLDPFKYEKKKVIRLKVCQHEFHLTCLEDCLKTHELCPMCRFSLTKNTQRASPIGSMTATTSSADVKGYKKKGSIVIQYNLPAQGAVYGNSFYIAYLPNIPKLQQLLKRLRFAFVHGLTFSISTGPSDATIGWAISHKTSREGGPYGWTDGKYFKKVDAELDALQVSISGLLCCLSRAGMWVPRVAMVRISQGINQSSVHNACCLSLLRLK